MSNNVVYIFEQDDSTIFNPQEISNIKALLQAGKCIGNFPQGTFTITDTNGVSYTLKNNPEIDPNDPNSDPNND
jgi:hypothetical protein